MSSRTPTTLEPMLASVASDATPAIAAHAERSPAAFIAFDLLRDGDAS